MNSDAAESFGSWVMGDDTRILDSVTSVNVACGFHGGDARTMHRVTALAAQRGIAVGAHVGYRDLPGFGRRIGDESLQSARVLHGRIIGDMPLDPRLRPRPLLLERLL